MRTVYVMNEKVNPPNACGRIEGNIYTLTHCKEVDKFELQQRYLKTYLTTCAELVRLYAPSQDDFRPGNIDDIAISLFWP
jgi:hypothetical protein